MDGMTYAPQAKKGERVIGQGEFLFGVIGLDHGHIYAMTGGLKEAGATLISVYDPDSEKVKAFLERHPEAQVASSEAEVLGDERLHLIASAIIPHQRARLGVAALKSGKHYFSDKPGALTKTDMQAIREAVEKYQKRYFIYFGERVHVEGALYAQQLIEDGVLGDIVSVTILAPHRLNKGARPSWFFNPEENGSILTDLGSHQVEQFLTYTGATSAEILDAATANFRNPDYPAFSDYGHCTLVTDTKAVCHFRVDWFTPDGMGAWGDGRLFIVGTKASVEVRKYLDVARTNEGDQVYLVDSEGEHHIAVHGEVGFPFFGAMILDCIHGTENAIGQEHTLTAMDLAIAAQEQAKRL